MVFRRQELHKALGKHFATQGDGQRQNMVGLFPRNERGEGRALMEKEGRRTEVKWEIVMSQNSRKDKSLNKMKSSSRPKVAEKTCNHCPEHREMSTNSLEMGITVFLKKEKIQDVGT